MPTNAFCSIWTQYFPPKPVYTDKDIPSDLSGKVYVVTGANCGMGRELSRKLYARNAKVYVVCRSEEKATQAIASIKESAPKSAGELIFISLDLSDLAKVKAAAQSFLAQESKLHVLFNNAGVMVAPSNPILKTVQGHELGLGVNCVGTFLFTKLLTPIMLATVPTEPPNTVRVIWLSSPAMVHFAPKEHGIDMDNLDYHIPKNHTERYGLSKSGDWLLGVEYARRHKSDGILSVPINPGNLATELARDQPGAFQLLAKALSYPVINGVYTLLFAGFSPEITIEKADWTKTWIIPWGRFARIRADLPKATKPVEEGGNGNAQEFWEWNEKQVKDFV